MTRERVQSTSTHTHFFRDAPQLASIAAVIARTAEQGARRPAVWSAGCSTGAEPYTLAMMCAEQGVEPAVRATDFNPGALAVARAGRYPAIALRQTPDAYVARYFAREADAYVVTPAVRARVTFAEADLRDAAGAGTAAPAHDVIVCRNVLIYYDRATASAIVAALAGALREGGALFVGATDHFAFDAPPTVRRRELHGALAYVRESAPASAPPAPRPTLRPSAAPPALRPPAPLPHVPDTRRAGATAPVDPVPSARDAVAALVAAAIARIGTHAWSEAEALLQRAEALDPLAPEPPLCLGVLRRKQHRLDEAVQALRRALFLEPELWPASFLLAGVWDRLRDRTRSERELARTLAVLEARRTPPGLAAVAAALRLEPTDVARVCRERLAR